MESTLKCGLRPLAPADARLIILGSLPGERSLAEQRYYAHPSNQFWRLLGEVLGDALCAMGNGARLERLATARIGLWDVIGAAHRSGSLDSAIRSPRSNSLAQWIGDFPDLRAIAFNGGTAARAGRRLLGGFDRIALLDLPSSSAAYTLPFLAKAERWRVIEPFIRD